MRKCFNVMCISVVMLACSPDQSRTAAAGSDVLPDTAVAVEAALQASDTFDAYEVEVGTSQQLIGMGTLTPYSYSHRSTEWPYGGGMLLWTVEEGTARALWLLRRAGDLYPHTVSWIDFDSDGRKDAFLLYGEETEFNSEVLLNRIGTISDPLRSFDSAYVTHLDYVTVVDMEGDGVPELLVPLDEPDHGSIGDRCSPPTSVSLAASALFDQIAGQYTDVNFDYGLGQAGGFWNLFLDRPFSLLRFKDGGFVDVTKEYMDHLRWRRGTLDRWAQEEPRCAGQLRSAQSYILGRLTD